MRTVFVFLLVFFTACTSDNSTAEKNSLSSIDSNTARNTVVTNTEQILVQSFTQLSSLINSCSALFVNDTTGSHAQEYYFVSNLKGLAFIKLNNRLMELKLVKQTNIDKYTVNELYVNDEVEVDLKITQLKEDLNATWNYKGVLVVTRGTKRDAMSIAGKLGC